MAGSGGIWHYIRMKVSHITGCALDTAVFGAMLVMNQSTGGMLAESLSFLFALPALAAAAVYPLRASVCADMAMLGLILILSGPAGWIGLPPYILAGAVTGWGMRRKVPRGRIVLFCSTVLSLLTFLQMQVFASLFGYDLQQLWFLEKWISPETILICTAAGMGICQSLILVLCGFLLQQRMPHYFGHPVFLRLQKPPAWTAVVFLLSGICIAVEWTVVKYPEGIRDLIAVSFLAAGVCMVYTAWVHGASGWLTRTSTGHVRPFWQRFLLVLLMWIPPFCLLFAFQGAWLLLAGIRKKREPEI